jgi:transposase-like protein
MLRKSPKFSPEVRERAVKLVAEHQAEYESQWAAIGTVNFGPPQKTEKIVR